MKKFIFLGFIFLLSLSLYGQRDSVCFTPEQILRINYVVDSLKSETTNKNNIITGYQKQVDNYTILKNQQEYEIKLLNAELEVNKQALERALQLAALSPIDEKWFESKPMYFLYGATLIFSGALVVSLIR